MKEKKQVLYVFGGAKAQGAEIVIERMMSYNTDKVNAHLFISPGDFADALIEAKKPYHITKINQLKKLNRSSTSAFKFIVRALTNYFSISYQVYKYLKKHNIHTVHANTMVPAAYMLPLVLYSRFFFKKVKWYWSDHDLKYFSKIDSIQSSLCCKLYDTTLVVSEAVKRKHHSSPKALVLYNGLDMNLFKADALVRAAFRSELGLAGHHLLIGIAASINPDKGQLELIEVFNQLIEEHPDIRLILAGSYAINTPEYESKIKATIGNNSAIIHKGFIKDMTTFYNGCDIVINNSNEHRSESLGTTIYEAMAFEKVVVASDTGGTPEIITDQKDGFLFKVDKGDALKAQLNDVINRYHSLTAVRTEARKKADDKFNIQTMISKYNAIIQ
ncbi:hypothetical protein GCM10027037_27290 [Mucilaginibacter koreensis]